jgi:dTDP-4-amino-4,6-dideoxygalactose transaminase
MAAVRIPMVDLRPALDATEAAWRANLARMFERMHFVLGEQVACFEQELARGFGAGFAVGVGTGTAALELCLRAAGLNGAGGEVLTSALTSPFTAAAIRAAGCLPRFADVDAETLLLDPEDAAARLTRRTAALVPVHLYGQLCPLPRLAALARRHRLALVQDACQAHGARFASRPLTSFSPWVAYSFYPTKNLGCLGDGGAVVTDRPAIAAKLRLLRDGGRLNDQVSRIPAINSRLDEMQACYLRAFLPHLSHWNAQRARLAALYDEGLRDCPGVRPVRHTAGSVYHLYVIRAARREELRRHLEGHGIVTGIHYPAPLHLHPAFRDCGLRRGDLPHAERACRQILSLPLWPYLPESAVDEVAARVRQFYSR